MRSGTKRSSKRRRSLNPRARYWRPKLWHVVSVVAAAAATSLFWGSQGDQAIDGDRAIDGWYRLTSIIPGERVPPWLHTGLIYRGTIEPGGQFVRLCAPDSSLAVVVSASLVTEVTGPLEQS
jgi:hypothetical protein